MRILHLVHQYIPDHIGGTELYTQTLARAQARRGDFAAVFAPSPQPVDRTLSETLEQEVTIYRVPVGKRGGTAVFRSTFGDERLTAALESVLDSFRPDVVHIEHMMGLPISITELLSTRRIPYVMALHDYWYGCANAQLLTNYDQTICDGPNAGATNCARCALARAGLSGTGWLAPAVAPVMRRRNAQLRQAVSRAALIIAPNEFVRATVASLGLPAERMIVLPWGMDLPADLQAIRETAGKERAARPAQPLRLGYIGSLSPQKGIHVLVAAVNRLPKDSVTLEIYGNLAVFPEYVNEVRRAATHPGIQLMGLLPRTEFWTRLAALDALVLPTLWYEASPLTIDEAFAAGTPVIGSHLGALPTMIRDGVDGLLFPAGDAGALAELLATLYEHPDRVVTLRQGIRPVKTMDTHAAEIAAWYEHVLEGTAGQT